MSNVHESDRQLNVTTTYQLKLMVMARVISEILLLLILIGIPPILLIAHHFNALPFAGRVVFSIACLIALVLLPFYGFVTWQVKTDAQGITSYSIFQRQSCVWQDIKTLARRSTWGWLRYVVEYEGGELSFPVLLKNCESLVQEVRSHLPAGISSGKSLRSFQIDTVAMLWQAGQMLYGIIFLAVTWAFFVAMAHSRGTNLFDSLVVLAFCICATSILLWRTFVIAMMPRSMEVKKDELVISNYFFQRTVPWKGVLAMKKPMLFLPEGFVLKTRSGSFLIGAHMNEVDELAEAIQEKMQHE